MTAAEQKLLAETMRQAERLGLLMSGEFIGPDGGVWTESGPVLSVRADRLAMRLQCPYPEFCFTPQKCAGKTYCQREICCAD